MISLVGALMGLASLASAQEDRPLAIPNTGAPRPPAVFRTEPPAVDAQITSAVRTYRAEALSLRSYSELHADTVWTRQVVWSPWGPGIATVPRPFYVQHTELGVFQGRQQLDIPQTLAALGDESGQAQLERRIRANRRASSTAFGLGVAGLAAAVVGLAGFDQASTVEEAQLYGSVSLGGFGLMAFGFLGGTFPSARAYRLQYEVEASQDLEVLEQRIVEHNRALAERLGLPEPDGVRPPQPRARSHASRRGR